MVGRTPYRDFASSEVTLFFRARLARGTCGVSFPLAWLAKTDPKIFRFYKPLPDQNGRPHMWDPDISIRCGTAHSDGNELMATDSDLPQMTAEIDALFEKTTQTNKARFVEYMKTFSDRYTKIYHAYGGCIKIILDGTSRLEIDSPKIIRYWQQGASEHLGSIQEMIKFCEDHPYLFGRFVLAIPNIDAQLRKLYDSYLQSVTPPSEDEAA